MHTNTDFAYLASFNICYETFDISTFSPLCPVCLGPWLYRLPSHLRGGVANGRGGVYN